MKATEKSINENEAMVEEIAEMLRNLSQTEIKRIRGVVRQMTLEHLRQGDGRC